MLSFSKFMAESSDINDDTLVSMSDKHKLHAKGLGGSLKKMNFYVTDHSGEVLGKGSKRSSTMKNAKLSSKEIADLDDMKNHLVKVDKHHGLGQTSVTYHTDPNEEQKYGSYRNLGYRGRRQWFKDHGEAVKFAKDLNGREIHKEHK